MSPRQKATRLGARAVLLVLICGGMWALAVFVLPGGGWDRPDKLTAFTLLALVGFIVLALTLHRKGWDEMMRDRIERKRRRRER